MIKRRQGKGARDQQRNGGPQLQSCCGAPKPKHYGDCPTRRKGK